MNIGGCSSFVKESEYKEYVEKALSAFDVLESETGAGNDFLGWKHLPSETPEELVKACEDVRDDWKSRNVDLVVVIGIGGSYLGAKCAIEALSHSFARELHRKDVPEVVFAGNNLSEEYVSELIDLMKVRNTACVVISKSGTTTEPAVAFRIVKQHLEEAYGQKEAAARIVAVTDAHKGALKTLSTQEGYRTFVVPDNVGGRFSVLTPVGLLPIVLAGFDIRALLEGAKEAEAALAEKSENNPAVVYAAMRNLLHSVYGKSVEILVSFSPKFQYLGEWWKQLYGESEGKDQRGIFPAAVDLTTDLHSMGQFIQDGARIMFETVLSVEESPAEIVLQKEDVDTDGMNYLAGQTVDFVNKSAMNGTILAHTDGNVPNLMVKIPSQDAYSLGQLFYFFEFACGVSGYLLGVNPFNQPGVESYKKNMFALLGKPGYEEAREALLKRL